MPLRLCEQALCLHGAVYGGDNSTTASGEESNFDAVAPGNT